MQKKLVQSSLALTAAAALGLGSAFVASPALADGPQKLDVQNDKQVQKALSDIDGVNAYGEKNGQLNLGVEEKTDEIEALEKKFDNVNVVEGVKELKRYASNDIVGGAGYYTMDGSTGGICSTGFSGWDGDGNPVVLTAGHCSKVIDKDSGEITGDTTVDDTEIPKTAPAKGGENTYDPSGNGILGSWGFHSYGSGDLLDGSEDPSTAKDSDIDFAVIKVDKSKYNVKNGVTDWSTPDDLSSSLKTNISKVGAEEAGSIQKSGRTTGVTEGEVDVAYNDAFEFQNVSGYWVHGFGVTTPSGDLFSDQGDSGGAVFQGDTAVGVISGGGTKEDGSELTWVSDLDHSLEQSDVDFNLEKPDETPEAPVAPTVSDQTIDPKGDISGKTVAGADVKVSWTGAEDGEAAVTADDSGNFSVTGPEAEGAYNAEAVATVDGQHSTAAAFKVTVKATDDSNANADGDDAKAETDADADAKDAEADAGADAKDADAAAAADGDDAKAKADADADAKDAEADADADAKDADAAAAADGDDANADADADAPETPDAPVVEDQKVDEGGQITGKTEADAKVELNWSPVTGTQSGVEVQAATAGSVTVTADAEGNFTADAPSEAGEYAYTATATTAAGTSETTKFTVTVEEAADDAEADADGGAADAGAEADADGAAADADAGAEADAGAAADAKNAESNADSDGSKDGEAPAERTINITPKEVAASDFVKKDKGVTITVKGFDEGENVSLEVVAGPENVEGITLDETANEDGVAAFSIYGTNASDPSAYLGKYDVQVTGANDTDDEKALAGSFSVVADEDGNGGGSDDGNGDGGSDLPRTGAELTGLAAGAGLLVVGGAAVVLTMRRNKKN